MSKGIVGLLCGQQAFLLSVLTGMDQFESPHTKKSAPIELCSSGSDGEPFCVPAAAAVLRRPVPAVVRADPAEL